MKSTIKVIKNKITPPQRKYQKTIQQPHITVLVRNEDQLKCCLKNNINTIYITDYSLYQKYKSISNIYYRTNRINNNKQEFINENLLITELGGISKYASNNNVIGDYYLNITNYHSIDFLKQQNVKRATISVELDDEVILNIMKESPSIPVELIIYGRLELMVMKYCPLKECLNYCNKCKQSKDKFYLEDKFNEKYPLIQENCITHILHSKNINKIDRINKYHEMGINYFRLELFEETSQELEKYINVIKENIINY